MNRFQCVLWSFGPSTKDFHSCHPVINIDDTHLYGKYKWKILVVVGVDSNDCRDKYLRRGFIFARNWPLTIGIEAVAILLALLGDPSLETLRHSTLGTPMRWTNPSHRIWPTTKSLTSVILRGQGSLVMISNWHLSWVPSTNTIYETKRISMLYPKTSLSITKTANMVIHTISCIRGVEINELTPGPRMADKTPVLAKYNTLCGSSSGIGPMWCSINTRSRHWSRKPLPSRWRQRGHIGLCRASPHLYRVTVAHIDKVQTVTLWVMPFDHF